MFWVFIDVHIARLYYTGTLSSITILFWNSPLNMRGFSSIIVVSLSLHPCIFYMSFRNLFYSVSFIYKTHWLGICEWRHIFTILDLNGIKLLSQIKPDMLQLRVPVWVSDMTFLPEPNCIALATRHCHVSQSLLCLFVAKDCCCF